MTLDWRTLEREIISILTDNNFDIHRRNGEAMLLIEHDFQMTYNLTTFAKDLAKRMEQAQ